MALFTRTHRTPAALTLGALASLGLVLTAAPASAHVRVDEGQPPPKGGHGIVRLIVPTESADASTVGLTVTLPDGVDLAAARTLPVAGWTAAVQTEPAGDTRRVSRITWRADQDSAGIKPSEFGEFTFSAGPWPEDSDTVALPTEQTYSDGTVVSWNEIAVDTDSEPEHPAPVVTLAATGTGHGHGHGEEAAGPDADTTVQASAHPTEWFWRFTSLAGLIIALGTAGLLAVTLRRDRDAGSS